MSIFGYNYNGQIYYLDNYSNDLVDEEISILTYVYWGRAILGESILTE